jgi:hypothetical protein
MVADPCAHPSETDVNFGFKQDFSLGGTGSTHHGQSMGRSGGSGKAIADILLRRPLLRFS